MKKTPEQSSSEALELAKAQFEMLTEHWPENDKANAFAAMLCMFNAGWNTGFETASHVFKCEKCSALRKEWHNAETCKCP